jgi:phosphatidylethanolamine/phosphatidyl-N-methylethanolamine N-methyltransferase
MFGESAQCPRRPEDTVPPGSVVFRVSGREKVMPMHLASNRIFLQNMARDFKRTGAVAPSSKALAQSITGELAHQYRHPATVLEVGAGTGSITEEIVRHISSGDSLDVFEIDRRFASLIRHRIKEDPAFRDVESDIRVFNKPIESIERKPRYDFIISCLPFTNFHPDAVRDIFEIYRAVLKPGGVCSFYEYLFMRRAVRIISGKLQERRRVAGVSLVVRNYIATYSYKHDVVFRNLPPAMVHHIRFAA